MMPLYKFKPLDFSMFPYFKGNRKTFGLWAAITSMSPLYTTISCWKYRHWELVIDPEWLRTRHCQLVKGNESNVASSEEK